MASVHWTVEAGIGVEGDAFHQLIVTSKQKGMIGAG